MSRSSSFLSENESRNELRENVHRDTNLIECGGSGYRLQGCKILPKPCLVLLSTQILQTESLLAYL